MTKLKSFLLVFSLHVFFLFQATKSPPPIIPKIAHKIKVQTVVHTPPAAPVVSVKKTPPPAVKLAPPKPKAAPKPPPPTVKKVVAKPPEPPKKKEVVKEIIPPTPIKQLNIETEPDPGALAELIALMQKTLALPEIGEVKIELTVAADGKVKKLKVLASESEANRHYLETELPELSFPSDREQTFTFAFHSVL